MPPGPKKSLKSSKKASNNPYQGNPNEKPAWWSNINSLTIISLIIIVIISISIIYHIFYYNISSSATIPSNTKPASGTLRLIKELESISGLGSKDASSLGQMSITEKTALLVKKLAESLPEDNIPSEAKTTTNTLKDGVESHHNKERGKNEEDKEKEEHNERYKKLLRDANEHQQEKDNKKHQKKKEVEKKDKDSHKKKDNNENHKLAKNQIPLNNTMPPVDGILHVTTYNGRLPILGPIPTSYILPLFKREHNHYSDSIFALACNYPKVFYQRFVGSLRKTGYKDDIVLAVSPQDKMKPGVSDYLKQTHVIAYPFEVDCIGKDNCKLKDEFLGYPDPRPYRTFANIRYALYEHWLRFYSEYSYILILDFRDTFFQVNPFLSFGNIRTRNPRSYDLQLYAENYKVKSIGICVYNSLWIGRCFGKGALEGLKPYPVICSGSTLGSFIAIRNYIRVMLWSMDKVQCWQRGIESDQGYQNFLYYNHYFDPPPGVTGNVTVFAQGDGVVNTIGAMNGFRVPKDKKGPLDTFWKIRDKDGYILNNDGTRSACIHQWDRWYSELKHFLDKQLIKV